MGSSSCKCDERILEKENTNEIKVNSDDKEFGYMEFKVTAKNYS